MSTTQNETKILVKGRLSYPSLFHATAMGNDATDKQKKFQTSILVLATNKDTRRSILKAQKAAEELGNTKKWPGKKINSPLPFKDGNLKDSDNEGTHKGTWYVLAKSKTKPSVVKNVKGKLVDVKEEDNEVYGGRNATVSISFYPFIYENKRMVCCGLHNVMIEEGGERFGAGYSSAEDDFGDLVEKDEDDDFDLDDDDLDF